MPPGVSFHQAQAWSGQGAPGSEKEEILLKRETELLKQEICLDREVL